MKERRETDELLHVALLDQINILANVPKTVDFSSFTAIYRLETNFMKSKDKGLYYSSVQQDVTVNFAKQLCFSFFLA